MNEQRYIIHDSSSYGMGSDTEEYLVTESNLRRIIKGEVREYRRELEERNKNEWDEEDFAHHEEIIHHRKYSGTLGKEVFCDSDDIDEVIEDVKKKRLSSISTYAKCKDLIKLADEYPVTVKKERYNDQVFQLRLHEFIVGKGEFTRYFLDLREYEGDRFDGKLGLKGGFWHEFASFQFENVLIRHHGGFKQDVFCNHPEFFLRKEDARGADFESLVAFHGGIGKEIDDLTNMDLDRILRSAFSF